jgi:predicted  nucleic acid-binding Zn-ribbon protein
MANKTTATEPITSSPLTIEQLQSKYEDLNRKKIEAETRHKVSQTELEKLRVQARSLWGTDDIEALKLKLVQMQRENEERRAKYQADLEAIEVKLEDIETKFSNLNANRE